MADYEIHFGFNNWAESFQLPINPDSISMNNDGSGKTYDIVGKGGGTAETRAGEVNVIKNPKLMEISFSGVFPATYYPFVLTDTLFEPMHYVNYIRKWQASKHPIRFVFVGHYYQAALKQLGKENLAKAYKDINIPTSIEKFSWKESAGSPGDIEYSITLKEYVFYAARKVTYTKNAKGETIITQSPPPRFDDRIRPDTYTWKEGDDWHKVVAKFFVDDDGFPDTSKVAYVIKYNNLPTQSKILKAVKAMKPGDVIKIPPY